MFSLLVYDSLLLKLRTKLDVPREHGDLFDDERKCAGASVCLDLCPSCQPPLYWLMEMSW